MPKILKTAEIEEIRERLRKRLHGGIWRDDQENLIVTIDAMRATLEAIKEGGNTADPCPYCHKRCERDTSCQDQGESVKPHGGGE